MRNKLLVVVLITLGLCACSRTENNTLSSKDETLSVAAETITMSETETIDETFENCTISRNEKTGKIKEVVNDANAKKTVECQLDKEAEEELVSVAKKLALNNIDFSFAQVVELKKEYNMVYSVTVSEKDERGFTTANTASVLFNGEGGLFYAVFSRDDCEYKEENIITAEEAYNKAIEGVLDKYPDLKNYSIKDGFEKIEKLRRDGNYKYIIPIIGDLDSLNGIKAFFSVTINAVTGECMEIASNLN